MDDRFSHVFKDPRFQRVPIKERKVKIDKRFKGMFNEDRFSLKYTVDKRGRPVDTSTNENLQKYYKLSSEDEDDEEEEEEEIESLSEDEKKKKGKEEKKKEKLKEKKEMKKKKKVEEVEEEEEVLVSNGVSSIPDEGVMLDPKKSVLNDSLLKIKKTKTSEKAETDKKTDLKGKRKLLLQLAELKKELKAKKKSKKEIEPQEEDEEEQEVLEDKSDEDAENEEEDVSEDEESEDSESGLGSGPDLARGIGNEDSSSEDSESDSESDAEAVPSTSAPEIVHDWGEFDKDVALTSDLSRRLAVCNMDWDNITATDLFVVINSFKPPGGTVLSVKIYLSDFGKQRLEEEAVKGPAELAEIALDADSEDDETKDQENDEGNSFHNEKLREYQLKRMKYYYAVIECDTIETANNIYSELDGAEYESSKTCFDLRFIPDDMEFNEDVKDACTELPNKDQYKPNQFLTTALSEAEVALTWDETDKKRLETTTKNYNKKNEIKLEDFKDYIALSSEEEEEEEDEEKEGSDASLISNSDNEVNDENDSDAEDGGKSHINKYKKLLEGIEETERKKEENQLEVTWDIGLKEKTEEVLKKKEKKKNATPWNEFLDKLKEKRKKRKEKTKALKKGEEKKDDVTQTFSDDDVPSDIDFNDPYFSSELLTAPKKKSKTQKKKEKKEKLLKKQRGDTEDYSGLTAEEIEQKKREKAELSLLMADDDDVNPKRHFDYEKIIKEESKSKPKKKKVKAEKLKDTDDDFKLDVNDDRFNAIYTSSMFNIDKSAPEYKKSDAMEALIDEKLRRRYIEKEGPESGRKSKDNSKPGTTPTRLSGDGLVASQPSKSVEESVNSLVRSIKTKTKNFNFSKTKPNVKGVNWKKMPKDL